MVLTALLSTIAWTDVTPVAALLVSVVSLLIAFRKNRRDESKVLEDGLVDTLEARIALLEDRLEECEKHRAQLQQELLELRHDINDVRLENLTLMKMLVKVPDH